jgi:predicted RNA-binding protein with PUA-like domain
LSSFASLLSLDRLREEFDADELAVVRRGNRLSILPVSEPTALKIYALLGAMP